MNVYAWDELQLLINSYSYYFFSALYQALWSFPGILALLLLFGALGVLLQRTGNWLAFRKPIIAVLVLAALVSLTFAYYSAVIEIEQQSDQVLKTKEFADDADCGVAWTRWTTSGIGLLNPCKKGCYRGATLHQQWRMHGFPPWPQNRREFQCWVRKPAAARGAPTANVPEEANPELSTGE